jgi:dedicator of cytokinesis protein 3
VAAVCRFVSDHQAVAESLANQISCDSLQLKYPEATLHRSKMQPSPPLRSGPDQIIWVTSVTPEPDLSQRMFADGVNENVQQYHRYNDIKTFSTLRPYKVLSSSSGGTEESAGVMTWLEKTVLTCTYCLHELD